MPGELSGTIMGCWIFSGGMGLASRANMQILIGLFLMMFAIACLQMPTEISDHSDNQSTLETTSDSSWPLIIALLNVGQGDATVIITPSRHVILIDGGPSSAGRESVLPFLEQWGVHHIDSIFVSHFDGDHIGGLVEIINGIDGREGTEDDLPVTTVYDRGRDPNPLTEVYTEYRERFSGRRQYLQVGDQWALNDGVSLEVIMVNGQTSISPEYVSDPIPENARSCVLQLSYGPFRYLTMGDLPSETKSTDGMLNLEQRVTEQVGDVNVLKVGHHGSLTSSSQGFIDLLHPAVALISAGNDNDYGHPHPDTVQRLLRSQAQVLTTQNEVALFDPHFWGLGDHIIIEVYQDYYTVDGVRFD